MEIWGMLNYVKVAKFRVLKSFSLHILEEGQYPAISLISDTEYHLRAMLTGRIQSLASVIDLGLLPSDSDSGWNYTPWALWGLQAAECTSRDFSASEVS